MKGMDTCVVVLYDVIVLHCRRHSLTGSNRGPLRDNHASASMLRYLRNIAEACNNACAKHDRQLHFPSSKLWSPQALAIRLARPQRCNAHFLPQIPTNLHCKQNQTVAFAFWASHLQLLRFL